ncbi:hypothetical protein P3T16_004030 [Paraburkholderia sp. GAS42]
MCFAARCGPDRLQRRKTMRQGDDLPVYLGLSMGDNFYFPYGDNFASLYVSRPQQIAQANVVWMLFMRTTLDQRCLRR